MLKLQKRREIWKIFRKRNEFLQNSPPDAQMAVVTTLKKNFRIKVFYSWLKNQLYVWNSVQVSKKVSPQKNPRILRLQFWQLGQTFSPKITKKSSFRILKEIAFFFDFKSFFLNLFPWTIFAFLATPKKFFATVPEISFITQKTWSFQQFLSKMLLCNCFYGHKQRSFASPTRKLPVNCKLFWSKSKKC